MFKEIYAGIKYPNFLDTIDTLKLTQLPPWEFLDKNYLSWRNDFETNGLHNFYPFARMVNDDVVAAFDPKSDHVFLFTTPLFQSSRPFKKLSNVNDWLKLVVDDCYEYISEY